MLDDVQNVVLAVAEIVSSLRHLSDHCGQTSTLTALMVVDSVQRGTVVARIKVCSDENTELLKSLSFQA